MQPNKTAVLILDISLSSESTGFSEHPNRFKMIELKNFLLKRYVRKGLARVGVYAYSMYKYICIVKIYSYLA